MKKFFGAGVVLLVVLGSVALVLAEIRETQKERGGQGCKMCMTEYFVWMDSKCSRQSCSVSLKTVVQRSPTSN
jgi:hypothetical protein